MECKKCNSNNVRVIPLVAVLLIGAAIIVWIPILGWIGAPLLLLSAIAALVIQTTRRLIKCNDCKNIFDVSTKEYKQYKKAIK